MSALLSLIIPTAIIFIVILAWLRPAFFRRLVPYFIVLLLCIVVIFFFFGPGQLEQRLTLALPLGLTVTLIWLLLRPTLFRRLLSGIREKTIYQTERTLVEAGSPPRIALPYVLVVWFFSFLGGIFSGPSSIGEFLLHHKEYTAYRNLAVVLLLVAALFIHLRPNHSRALKYTLVLALLPVLSLFIAGASVRELFGASDASTVDLFRLLVATWFVFVFIAVSLSISYWTKIISNPGSTGSKIALYIFSFVRMRLFGPLVLLCLIFFHEIAIVLLGVRYVLVEAFRRHPIVYLRSFHYEGAATTFGRALAPALAPFGVIRALVHGSQTGRILLSSTSIWQFGLLATVSDASWQSWVLSAIKSSSLTIIDRSVPTESVDWEIQTALRELGPSRVLVITQDQAPVATAKGARIISYSTDLGGLDRLRTQVASWASEELKFSMRRARIVRACLWLFILAMIVVRLQQISYFAESLSTPLQKLEPSASPSHGPRN